MIGRKSPQRAASNLRDVREPARLQGAFNTLLRCCTNQAPPHDLIAAERGRLWRAMRVLREFDAPMLALVSVASQAVAGRLIAELVAGGILSAIGDDDDCPRYRLMRDPGAALPVGEVSHG